MSPGDGDATLQWRCLVVDDSPLVRKMMIDALTRIAGLSVEGAADGEEALGRCEGACFDVVLTDRDMPRLDGVSLVARLRQRSVYATVPVVMVSSEASPEAQDAARAAGVSVYLRKPVAPVQLRALVCTLLNIPPEHARALSP